MHRSAPSYPWVMGVTGVREAAKNGSFHFGSHICIYLYRYTYVHIYIKVGFLYVRISLPVDSAAGNETSRSSKDDSIPAAKTPKAESHIWAAWNRGRNSSHFWDTRICLNQKRVPHFIHWSLKREPIRLKGTWLGFPIPARPRHQKVLLIVDETGGISVYPKIILWVDEETTQQVMSITK